MSVQVIMKDGRPEWAVIPYAEYEVLLAKVAAIGAVAPAADVAVEVASGESAAAVAPALTGDPSRGRRLRQLREQSGRDLTSVARAAGISPSYLQMMEDGTREASDAILHSLARALSVPLSQLADE